MNGHASGTLQVLPAVPGITVADPHGRVIALIDTEGRPAAAAGIRFNGCNSLTEALVNAYYQRDIETIRRIGAQVESSLVILSTVLHDQVLR